MEIKWQTNHFTGKEYYIITDTEGNDMDIGPFDTREEALKALEQL